MTTNIFSEDKDKNFDVKDNTKYYYIFCDQCAWNGFPNEKIVRVFHGLRSENQDGFIYRYTEYDYDPLGKSKVIHVHKYNPNIIDAQVRIALENQKGVNYVK
jgi:predicted nucleic-acid-binding Zn-ribbon protein